MGADLELIEGRGAKLASGVEVPVLRPRWVSLAVKDLPAFTGSTAAILDVKLRSVSVSRLLTSAPPLLLTTSLTAVYTCMPNTLMGCTTHDMPHTLTGAIAQCDLLLFDWHHFSSLTAALIC